MLAGEMLFQQYRDAGPGRSLAKLAAMLQRSKRLLERWSARWSWVLRCRAWDAEQDRLTREAFTRARLEKTQQAINDLELFQGLARRRYVEFAKRIQQMPEAISKREEEAQYLLGDERLRGMYARLPAALKPRTRAQKNAAETWALANGSVARALPSNAGDGYTASLVLADEADLVPDLERLLRSAKPTIDAPGHSAGPPLQRPDLAGPGAGQGLRLQGQDLPLPVRRGQGHHRLAL
jgi:hypothetical protein